jgi:hypothetical protein
VATAATDAAVEPGLGLEGACKGEWGAAEAALDCGACTVQSPGATPAAVPHQHAGELPRSAHATSDAPPSSAPGAASPPPTPSMDLVAPTAWSSGVGLWAGRCRLTRGTPSSEGRLRDTSAALLRTPERRLAALLPRLPPVPVPVPVPPVPTLPPLRWADVPRGGRVGVRLWVSGEACTRAACAAGERLW